MKLAGGLEDETSHPKALSGIGISRDIVNEDGFLGADFACAKGLCVDERIGFVGADAKGIKRIGKNRKKGKRASASDM